jgi:hypothetical protein
MTRKDVPDRVLESSEILQEFTEKPQQEKAVQKKLRTKHGKFVSFSVFLHVPNYHSDIFNVFQCNKISL